MLTLEQRAAIVVWCKEMVARVNRMHWLFDQRTTIAQAAAAVLPATAAVPLSWNAQLIHDIWQEVVYG